MIIYTLPNDSVKDIWTKAGLISIREYERKVVADADYQKTCVARKAPGGYTDTVLCDKSALLTPLSLIPNSNNLENMTD